MCDLFYFIYTVLFLSINIIQRNLGLKVLGEVSEILSTLWRVKLLGYQIQWTVINILEWKCNLVWEDEVLSW